VKILMTADCVVDLGTDAGGEHCAAGAVIEVRADTAHALARLGRARYVSAADDPTRGKYLTASPEQLPAQSRAPRARAPARTADAPAQPDLEDPPRD
jgi:hypothetical protein